MQGLTRKVRALSLSYTNFQPTIKVITNLRENSIKYYGVLKSKDLVRVGSCGPRRSAWSAHMDIKGSAVIHVDRVVRCCQRQ